MAVTEGATASIVGVGIDVDVGVDVFSCSPTGSVLDVVPELDAQAAKASAKREKSKMKVVSL